MEPLLAPSLIEIDKSAPLPIPEQIYRSLRVAVQKQMLAPGHRLPSSRELAQHLGVSRNSVNTAYDLLKAESIVTVKRGASPVVAGSMELEGKSQVSEAPAFRPRMSKRGERQTADYRGPYWAKGAGVLQSGAPARDLFPYDMWARCLRRAVRSLKSDFLLYQDATGYRPLKETLATYLSSERGVRAKPDQIIITSTMQGTLTALATALADPGDAVWIEDPGYLGARSAFLSAGLTPSGIPVDAEGCTVPPKGEVPDPRLIYVSPSHQFPLGVKMSLARRLALIERARRSGAIILEDDYDSEFLFESRPVAAMQGLAEEGEVIYLGTFSKSLLPGLRIAFCVVPDALVEPLQRLFRYTGCIANVHVQAALADFIESGHYRSHLRRIRQEYESRGRLMVRIFRDILGNRISVEPPTGNVQLVLQLNSGHDDCELAIALQKRGFSVSPVSQSYLGQAQMRGLLVGFADANEAQMIAFAREVGSLLDGDA